jgi:tetratricopeptide (TPR) repeat protein
LHSPFIFDDKPNISENPRMRLARLDVQKLYNAGFKSPSSNRPVANISFALNYYFGGYDTTGYHTVNIIIHLMNGILVYFLALRLYNHISLLPSQPSGYSARFQAFLMSLFLSLFFIAHPLQTESVTYIVQRMNSMSAMFLLLSLLFYIMGRSSVTAWKRRALFLSCLLSWLMALGSKENAITLPFIIFLYEWYFLQDLSISWLKRNVKYLLIPVAVLCLFAFIYLEYDPIDKILSSYERRDFTLWERVLTQFRVVVFYISLILYPQTSRLNLNHHFNISHSLIDPITTALCLLVILVLICLAVYYIKRNRLISFGILWFFINLALESSVIGLELIYEHRLYLPILGPALIISWLVFHFLSHKRVWAIAVSAAIIVTLSIGTHLRNKIWQDEIILWSDVVSKNPSLRAHYNLGLAFADQGMTKKAVEHFTEALRINPRDLGAHNNLGLALMHQGLIEEAIRHYRMALKINPRYISAHNNLGLALVKKRLIEEAIRHYRKALEINPMATAAHNNLGLALVEKQLIEEAIRHYRIALKINPNMKDVHINLKIALTIQKQKQVHNQSSGGGERRP